MASVVERVVVNPDHLIGHDGTVKTALEMWSSRAGPVKYNPWQSVYWSLIRDFGLEDVERVPGESQKDVAARIRRYFEEIQTELHGPDFLAAAIVAERTAAGSDLAAIAEAEREGAIARRGKQPKRKAARLRGRAKPKDQRAQERGAVGGPENPTRPGEQLAEPPPTFPGRPTGDAPGHMLRECGDPPLT